MESAIRRPEQPHTRVTRQQHVLVPSLFARMLQDAVERLMWATKACRLQKFLAKTFTGRARGGISNTV
jgi:hypothetical protein